MRLRLFRSLLVTAALIAAPLSAVASTATAPPAHASLSGCRLDFNTGGIYGQIYALTECVPSSSYAILEVCVAHWTGSYYNFDACDTNYGSNYIAAFSACPFRGTTAVADYTWTNYGWFGPEAVTGVHC